MQVTVLEAMQQAVAVAAERVGPAVVGLGRGWARGSGVVVAPGRVLTVAHALRGEDVAVTFADGRTESGRVAGADSDLDVAVVAVETGEAPAVTWEPQAVAAAAGTGAGSPSAGAGSPGAGAGSSDAGAVDRGAAGGLSIGAPVLALANPGGHGLRVTFGLVSATGRSFRGPRGRRSPGSIEHTAPLPRGSSGGPLVDPAGRLLGLNAVRRDGGLILAVPADEALRRRVDALARGEGGERPRLGIALAHPRAARRMRAAVGLPARDGLLVRGIVDGSPAAAAGLERGDLLVGADNAPLTSADDLFDALDRAGETLTLRVIRGTDERDVAVALR
ncbi:MAG TPA: S1C family serine protease [Solirubrobacter sp.]|nr:S1C family serine protease [Solirubrobacter sp.]